MAIRSPAGSRRVRGVGAHGLRPYAALLVGFGVAASAASRLLDHHATHPTRTLASSGPCPGARGIGERPIEGRPTDDFGPLPLVFEPNLGQTDPVVEYLARGPGSVLFLTADEAVLSITRRNRPRAVRIPSSAPHRGPPVEFVHSTLRIQFAGADPASRPGGLSALTGTSHYFTGRDPTRWRTRVPHYGRVGYANLYPGIDLVFYGNPQGFEYDFVVAPGADPARISLAYHGASRIEIDANGDLLLHTEAAVLRQHRPLIYQDGDGSRKLIDGGYVQRAANQVGFSVGPHDPGRRLLIDPVLSYSTYLGGSAGDYADDLAVDAAGNAYVTGSTGSTDFPVTPGSMQSAINGTVDAFVAKLDPTGRTLLFATFLGGSAWDYGLGLALDPEGAIYVAGRTDSTDFPTVNAFQNDHAGDADAFVAKLSPDGSALLYASFLGGPGFEAATDIAADGSAHAYVTGNAQGTQLPTTPGAMFTSPSRGFSDAFVAGIDTGASEQASLVYCSYIHGRSPTDSGETYGLGVATDGAGNAYVTGFTSSRQFITTPGSFQVAHGGGFFDAYVLEISLDGTFPWYGTYLGGSGDEGGHGITLDALSNAYVTGSTSSVNFPRVDPVQATLDGFSDAYVARLNSDGSALLFSTFLGGSGYDTGEGIAVGEDGRIYVTGNTESTDFPTVDPLQSIHGGGIRDAFVSVLNPADSTVVYSTLLGGGGELPAGDDEPHAIATDALGNVWMAGTTYSDDFPTTREGVQHENPGGNVNAFALKISPGTVPCRDADGDGYGSPGDPTCRLGAAADCDDSRRRVYPGRPQTCDGLNNDCDHPEWPSLSATNESDDDADGLSECQGDCDDDNPARSPSAGEVCDNLDNDCDDSVDEDTPGSGLPCGTTDLGECGFGLTACISGAFGCAGNVEPIAEACDGLDNDCDGTADDGNPNGGAPCETGEPGACASGTLRCLESTLRCVPNSAATGEICDGLDNDCDALTDEGFPDAEGDAAPDCHDNCPFVWNSDQDDEDADGTGDSCESATLFAAANLSTTGFSSARIDGRDLALFADAFGTCPGAALYDDAANLDGVPAGAGACVDLMDFHLFLDRFGQVQGG